MKCILALKLNSPSFEILIELILVFIILVNKYLLRLKDSMLIFSMRIRSQELHFRHKVWMACLEKMHHSRRRDNWQYGASSQPKEYELKFFLKLLYFLFLKENLAAKIDIINIINCSRHIAHDRSSFNSPSTMLMNECHFFCWFLYIGDNDDNMIFFGSYCLFVALVVKFAPSLRSGDANVTTQDTNKQYALQKSCYCLITKI